MSETGAGGFTERFAVQGAQSGAQPGASALLATCQNPAGEWSAAVYDVLRLDGSHPKNWMRAALLGPGAMSE